MVLRSIFESIFFLQKKKLSRVYSVITKSNKNKYCAWPQRLLHSVNNTVIPVTLIARLDFFMLNVVVRLSPNYLLLYWFTPVSLEQNTARESNPARVEKFLSWKLPFLNVTRPAKHKQVGTPGLKYLFFVPWQIFNLFYWSSTSTYTKYYLYVQFFWKICNKTGFRPVSWQQQG